MKIRYETATGKVNLFTTGDQEMAVAGCKYMVVPTRPNYDDTCEHLYVKNGKLVAVNIENGKEHAA